MKKMKKNIFIFFMLLIAIVLGDEIKIPHERITENPKMEVTTVESKKLRENAKLDISVNKKNIDEIEGFEKDGKIVFILPEDKTKMIRDEEVIVVKSLAELPNTYQGNKRNKRAAAKTYPIEEDDKIGVKSVTVDKSEAELQAYIASIDKTTNEISKVYKGIIVQKSTVSPRWYYPSHGSPSQGTGYQPDIYLRLEIKSDNTFSDKTYFKEFRIWSDKWWLRGVTNGFEDMLFTGEKLGNSSDRINMKITRFYQLQTGASHASLWNYRLKFGTGGQKIDDNLSLGFRLTNLLEYEGGTNSYTSLQGVTNIDVDMRFTIDSTLQQLDYSKTGGIFQITGISSQGIHGDGTNGSWRYTKSPERVNVLVPRRDKSYSIDLYSSQLDLNSKISLLDSGITKNLGYVDDGVTSFDVIDMDTSGLILDASGLKIPTNLKSGTYRLKVAWKTNSTEYGNQMINELDDIITINYFAPVQIGEVEFQVDQRLKKLIGSWVRANGGVSSGVDGSVKLYPELVRLNNNFSNLESVKIIDVVSVEGRDTKSDFAGYKVFTTAPGIETDESAIPFDINLNELRNNLIISTNNSADPDMLNNRFTLLGENGKHYKGNIKENYDTSSPEDGYTGKVKLELKNFEMNKVYTFDSSETGTVSSVENSSIKLTLESGKLPQTNGYHTKNIVDSLNVSINGSTATVVAGKVYENENYRISLNNVDGNLEITKLREDVAYSDTLDISYR
ncbi:MAG: hypothetical protein ACRC92_01015, partial [Peptostreptococcaceae bacterium]